MAGFSNGVMTANNVDFTGNIQAAPTVTLDGQLLIGSTAAPNIRVGSLTSTGGSVTISYASPNVNIEVDQSGFNWVNQTADLNPLVKENAYVANKAGTRLAVTLPTGGTFGDYIKLVGFGATGWQLNAGAGQTIVGGSVSTTVAGSVSSTNQFDTIELVCSPTTTTWLAVVRNGNLTYA